MTDDANAVPARPTGQDVGLKFTALVILTAMELVVVSVPLPRAGRIVVLSALLIAKVGLMLSEVMRARDNRRAAALTLLAVPFAAAIAVVLMLETMFRVGVR